MGFPDNQKKIQHLFSRAAFGISPAELIRRKNQDPAQALDELFRTSEQFTGLDILDKEAMAELQQMRRKNLNAEDRKKLNKARRRSLLDLNLAWLDKLSHGPAMLRERMTFFWHGHFACRLEAPYIIQQLNNIHRTYALGKFRDLLMAVSKSPAMLSFLNNQQNRKMHPNENFAREVMELFTIGRGNYTEQDVKEGARAFTGWGFDRQTGDFVFRENQHDDGSKTFLGKTGNFKGEDVIDILLERKETALFLCRKICRFFVNDTPDEAQVQNLAEDFYKSNYDIGALLRKLFSSDWFYKPENIGVKIKSPVDLLVGIHKFIPVTYENKDPLLLFQRALGQVLFYPPNVSGWAGGRTWIDSSSLMFRLRAPSLLLNKGHIDVEPKEDMLDDRTANMYQQNSRKEQVKGAKKFESHPDWNSIMSVLPETISKEEIISLVLLPDASAALRKNLDEVHSDTKQELILELMSAPEYQMA